MKSVVLFLLFACFRFLAIAQQECRSTPYKDEQIRQFPQLASNIAAIESFTQDWLQKRKTAVNDIHSPVHDIPLITIPVVVHILYNTAAQNIPDVQVLSQIDVLNRDYRRLNADTVRTPDIFKEFAADCGIQFVLAKVDPAGHATNGIVRKRSNMLAFNIDDHIKSAATGGDDAWEASSYLNIWVGNLSTGILGYSSVPGCNKEKDGIVIQYTAFGTTGSLIAPYNKGRTATHEIGHWLNLIHTWGDAECGDDRVDDTPPQKGPNRACPGAIRITCGTGPYGDMYMNYMDFTDDACLNMFSDGQRERMRALFAPGGPRNSLLNSAAATAASGSAPVDLIPTTDNGNGSLQIYPNPAYQLVSIQISDSLPAPLVLGIYNAMGQKVMTTLLTQHLQQVNVERLPQGVYYIKTENSKNRYIARMVKM
ncbi:MAG TPA: M43 family zinc metalloprotease [Puia sp.]|nr:M43 family zinc metalloprotease [Puia sp.]